MARPGEKSSPDPIADAGLQYLSEAAKAAETLTTLDQLPLGGRLLVRSKKDWRVAVVSRISEGQVTISVASPRGGCYRLRRAFDAQIVFDGQIPFLKVDPSEPWRENFVSYDVRW
jgi:hypothetical protein